MQEEVVIRHAASTTPWRGPRLDARCSASSIDASTSGLGACLRKQPFAKPTSNKHKLNRAYCKRPRRGRDTLTEGFDLLESLALLFCADLTE